MTSSFDYKPPKVWSWDKPNGGRFANINRPIAGPTHDKELPIGRHPLQLYSLGTPNGVKVTTMLEELLALGPSGAESEGANHVFDFVGLKSVAEQGLAMLGVGGGLYLVGVARPD